MLACVYVGTDRGLKRGMYVVIHTYLFIYLFIRGFRIEAIKWALEGPEATAVLRTV